MNFNYDELIRRFDEYKIYNKLINKKSKVQVKKYVKTEIKNNFEYKNKCPICNSVNYEKKGFRNEKQRYVCKDCGRNWTFNGDVKNIVPRKSKIKDVFQRENPLEEIVAYLKNQETNNMHKS